MLPQEHLSTIHLFDWCLKIMKSCVFGSILFSATSVWWMTLAVGGSSFVILSYYGLMLQKFKRGLQG